MREPGDEMLKKIAIEITEKLRASTAVDWQAHRGKVFQSMSWGRMLTKAHCFQPIRWV
jgi:hypothetical protein